MAEFVLSAAGAARVDTRLAQVGLLDLTMEEAGRAVAEVALRLAPRGWTVLLAGSGANGGDAFVAARHLRRAGADVLVLARPSRHPLTRLNRRRWAAVGGATATLTPAALTRQRGAALLIDGLLGTGFQAPLRADLAALLEAAGTLRAEGTPVLAIDLPSGLDAGQSRTVGPCLGADHTVTLMGWKTTLLFGEAAAHGGTVHLVPLSVPPEWVRPEAQATIPDDAELAAWLPRRRRDAHKGVAGRVAVLGGSPGLSGAPVLAGVGALRAGAGLVHLHSLAELPPAMPELMVERHEGWPATLDRVRAQRPDAVAVGMGLGADAPGVAREVLDWGCPTVIDADALHSELAGAGHAACIWTPHPGEAARLLGTDTASVTLDPLAAAAELQRRLGGVVVLKGGPSVVAADRGVTVSRGGHPGMASAGMGDTLAGILAALLAQGLSSHAAAGVGVRLHALAGERAAARHGYGLSASDVAQELGGAWRALSEIPGKLSGAPW